MKRSLLVAAGLAIALSVGAQTSPDEQKEQKEKKEKAKTEESAQPAEHQGAKPGMQPKQHPAGVQTKQRERTEATDQQVAHPKTHETTKVNEKTAAKTSTSTETKKEGAAVKTTTVFRNGKQTNEHISLHRSTRERTDVHFSIGTHPRAWWLSTYSVVLLEGCYYYLADNGCWYPAYGFDPGCTFPVGVVFCE